MLGQSLGYPALPTKTASPLLVLDTAQWPEARLRQAQLKPDAVAVIHPPRRIPVALNDKLEKELMRMEDLDVIVRVSEPIDWVNSIATPKKQRTDAWRVCLDSRDLNQAIKREHYPLLNLEDLTLLLSDAKYFIVLDATLGYWQIMLDDERSLLTTFNAPFKQNALRSSLKSEYRSIPENNGLGI